ncbi:ABC transporter ATP-binding protein [Paeniglutamicibacter psychrophenolicus]|uniref:ABC-type multidrug transport system fused ATPase/permease subunit n=1 Tax=Paeniglutamicibacter psychrophenolicus TaxID=257454 RepID=A0ABS4W7H7_9MICC|nr:ABC-type multidrug transport system fused ATPase/permease subunit [Paeniglutamicibacter psychrophenolicus]
MSGHDALMEDRRAPATAPLGIVPAPADRGPAPRLPKLVTGKRRGLFLALLALATGCGALGVAIALLVGALVTGAAVLPLATGIGALILLLGAGRYSERVLAEKLGQHYVAQLRLSLISHSLLAPKVPSVGITVARASNDLSSVRNWVAQGIAPLLAGIPLVLISMAGLFALHPALALALGVPVLVLAGVLLLLARPAYERARTLRRHRGNLAARIADTVAASSAVVAAGGVSRELSRVEASGNRVVDAAVARARLAAVLRACSLGMPLLATAVVVLVSRTAALGPGHIATALTLLGLCAAPVGEWGRIVEYRQNYRAASRIIAPLLAEEGTLSADPRLRPGATRAAAEIQASRISGVWLRGVELDGRPVPELDAKPGDRIRMVGADARARGELFGMLATARTAGGPILGDLGEDAAGRGAGYVVAGVVPAAVAEKKRRRLIGAAFASMVPERGTVLRALRYRRPEASPAKALALAARLGLDAASLEHGETTLLRRGGMPLDAAQRAGLMVARAMLGSPELLLLNEIDSHLDAAARRELEAMLQSYRGVVIVGSDAAWCSGYREWDLDGPAA